MKNQLKKGIPFIFLLIIFIVPQSYTQGNKSPKNKYDKKLELLKQYYKDRKVQDINANSAFDFFFVAFCLRVIVVLFPFVPSVPFVANCCKKEISMAVSYRQ